MKKFVSVVIVALLILSFVEASAVTTPCSRHGRAYEEEYGDPKRTGVYTYYDSTYHLVEYLTYCGCQMCNIGGNMLSTWLKYTQVQEAHPYEWVSDGGHVYGSSTHLRNLQCKVCNRYYSQSVTCYGPPCLTYLSIPHPIVYE